MVIAVIIVGVVQTSIYQIVVVIAVWNEWMSASIMAALTCNGGADIGVIGADCEHTHHSAPHAGSADVHRADNPRARREERECARNARCGHEDAVREPYAT